MLREDNRHRLQWQFHLENYLIGVHSEAETETGMEMETETETETGGGLLPDFAKRFLNMKVIALSWPRVTLFQIETGSWQDRVWRGESCAGK